MKKQILITLILVSSILTMNAQWDTNGDNWTTGNLTLRNMNNATNAGSFIHLTSYSDWCLGPKISSVLRFASGTGSKSDLVLSSYWEGYKNEMILSNGNINMNANITLNNWTNESNAGNIINFTAYGTEHLGPQIKSSLKYASGTNSKADLILSSYWEGYKNELILSNGNVGIGTTTPEYKLDVVGTIRAHEVIVNLLKQADYVFDPTYKLMSLPDIEQYVKLHKHLPEIPSAAEVAENGLNMGDMQNKLLQKVEELTLYVIEQNKKIEILEKELNAQKNK